MALYKQTQNKLLAVKERQVALERDIQKVVEANLAELLGLQFVSSEFPLDNLRIDTLAFDEESKSFVVVEYKRDRSFSVIDQGYAYLALIFNNRSDFVLEYYEKCNKSLHRDDIDWSQTRVIFMAQAFTKYQREAMGFKDLPIELWEVKKYEGGLIAFNQLQTSQKKESIKVLKGNQAMKEVSREVRQYSVDDLFKPKWEESKALFDELVQRTLAIDSNFEVRPTKFYLGFTINKKIVFAVKARSSKLVVELYRVRPEDLKDPEKRAKYRKNSYEFFNKHISTLDVATEDDLDYTMLLVKQVLKVLLD